MSKKIGSLSVCGAAMFLSLLVSSAWGYEKEIEELSTKMAEKIAGKGKARIAVVDFSNFEGYVSYFDRLLAEQFTITLTGAGKGFRVIDRNNLNSIIKEHNLSATGLIAPETARKLGRIAGVDALVTGTLTPFGNNVKFIVKVLDTETADVIDSAEINIARTEAVNELLRKKISINSPETEPPHEEGESGAFFDDFNRGPKPDWKPINGNWTMDNGQYTITDIKGKEAYFAILEGKKWKDSVLSISVTPGNILNRWKEGEYKAGICPRMISVADRVCLGISGKDGFNELYWYVVKEGNGGEPFGRKTIKTSAEQTVNLKIEVKGKIFTAYIDDVKISEVYDTSFPAGSIGLIQWYQWWDEAKVRIVFDNIKIKPIAD